MTKKCKHCLHYDNAKEGDYPHAECKRSWKTNTQAFCKELIWGDQY